MALSSLIEWEIRTGGSDTNGGGFKSGATGQDYSQQNAAQYALTGLTTAAANAIILTTSAATDPFTNAAGGNFGLNATAGGGAACKTAGYPQTVFNSSTNAHTNIGVDQQSGSAGGLITHPGMAGGLRG